MSTEINIDNRQAKGGKARAKNLSATRRTEIARRASEARWYGDLPQATHEGPVRIADREVVAAVLPNGMRLLTQGTFLRALGRSRTPKAGTGGLATVDGLPFFLSAHQLRPFISDELRAATTPVLFRMKAGRRAIGYDANLLSQVCEVYLRYRDFCLRERGEVPRGYRHIVDTCDLLMRGFAAVGLPALIDEATGYQEVRERHALQAILDKYLLKEFAAWAKRFPDEFYREIFRLRGWTWRGMSGNRPQAVAQYTNDIVYQRIAPGLLQELRQRNPVDERGRRKAKHHQFLTEDVGHPALAQHVYAVITLMRVSNGWEQFMGMLDRAHPKKNSQLRLLIEPGP